MIIAVDFDGTIVEHQFPNIGKERPGAIDTLKKLSVKHRIILWTVRQGKELQEAVDYCAERGLTFFAVNSDTPGGTWDGAGARKLRADLFIDDANLGGLPDWDVIYEMILTHSSFGDVMQNRLYGGESGGSAHKKRKSLIARISDRCRRARQKVGHSGGRYSRHW